MENRSRLLRELTEDVKTAVGQHAAVAIRLSVDELNGANGLSATGEGRDIVALLAELPDLWDVSVSPWANDSATSRFVGEGWQEPYVAFVKSVTSKPVVGVGLFTSPDTMADQVRRGILDLVGMTRASIADPFLPAKVAAGRVGDIRECIGCNICVASHNSSVPLRCTQNPTAGEEWRRGWHPETMPRARTAERVAVIGAGPAGLECALALGRQGHRVMLADADRELGGRVTRESRLPGLARWARVRDWRVAQIQKLDTVEVFRQSRMTAADIRALDVSHIVIATGASWRRDGLGRAHAQPLPVAQGAVVLTPDDLMEGRTVEGPVVVYDDDHYYMGGVIAELLRKQGHAVTLVTPGADIAAWTSYTLEQAWIVRRLAQAGIVMRTRTALSEITADEIVLAGGETIPARTTVLVTSREPRDALYRELVEHSAAAVPIGDCAAPGTIAAAVFGGHAHARRLGGDTTYRRERHVFPA